MSGPVSSRLAGVERRLSTIGNQVALAAAQAVADGVTSEVGAAGGALSRYRGGGPIRVEARQRGANTAEVVPTSGAGQLAILDTGAKAHQIGGRGKVLRLQGGGFVSGAVAHPGARGKQVWTRGTNKGVPAARAEADRLMGTVLDG